MIALTGGVFECGSDITSLDHWIIFQNFLVARACGKEIEQIFYPNAQTSNTRSPATLCWIDGYTMRFAHDSFPMRDLAVTVAIIT